MADGQEDVKAPEAAPRGRSRLVPAIVVLFLIVSEAVGIAVLIKAVSPAPIVAQADEGDDGSGDGEEEPISIEGELKEIELADCRPSNRMSGKFVTYHIRVSALVPAGQYDAIDDMVRARKARIEDGVNTVIRSAEPKFLTDPRLDTIRRHLKTELDRIFGDEGLIKEVLIPELQESR